MLLAHLPSGYIIGHLFASYIKRPKLQKPIIGTSLVASVLPDVDMLYWFLIDNQQHDHHIYWSHIPIVYCALLPLVLLGLLRKKWHNMSLLMGIAWVNLMMHAVLDTVISGILWTYPFITRHKSNLIHIVDNTAIPEIWNAKHVFVAVGDIQLQGWVLNLLLHWSSLFELVLIIVAIVVFFKRRRMAVG